MADNTDNRDDHLDVEARARRKTSGNGALVAMICLGLLLVGGMVFALLWFLGGSGGNLDAEMLAYLPAETNVMAGVEVEDLLKNDKAKKFLDLFFESNDGKKFRDGMKEAGIGENDISRIVMGGKPSAAVETGGPDGKVTREEPLQPFAAVVRFKKAVEKAKIAKALGLTEQTKNGKTYYKSSGEAKAPFLWFPSESLMVVASTEKQIDDLQSKEPGKVVIADEMRDLAKKMSKGHVWVVASRSALPNEAWQYVSAAKEMRIAYAPKELLDAVKDMKGGGIWARVDGDRVSFGVVAQCANKDAAAKAETAEQKEINQRRDKDVDIDPIIAKFLKKDPERFKTFVGNLKKSLAVERSGELLEISGNFSISDAEKFVERRIK